VGERQREAATLHGLGTVYDQLGERQKALDYCNQALSLSRAVGDRFGEAAALFSLARVERDRSHLTEARAQIESALHITESLRAKVASQELRASYLASVRGSYEFYVDLLMQLHQVEPSKGYATMAFQASERARARSLLDLLAEANIELQQGIAPALKRRERDTHARIAWIQRQLIQAQSGPSPDERAIAQLEEQLKQIEREREQLEIEIKRNHPRYAELQYPTPLGLKAIQDLLDEQTALLEYALGEDRSFLFAITKTDYSVVELPPASSIADQVKQLRETLITKPQRQHFPTYIEQARSLHQALVEPARKFLAEKKHLLIVPDGILHYLPFEVLLSSGDEKNLTTVGPRRWPYLVRDYAISYVPSANVLASLPRFRQAKPEQQKVFLAYADPAYGSAELTDTNPLRSALRSAFGEARPWQLERLTYSREEANRIAALYPPDKVRLFLQQDAREENVKVEGQLSQYRFIHFAAHGLLSENKPQYSGLVLSLPPLGGSRPKTQDSRPTDTAAQAGSPHEQQTKDQGPRTKDTVEDGLLQVYEIFDLKLNADLVVLSACETGLGKEVKGEGLIGLTRAFLYAGTPSVVVSLWKVSDRSTAELMVSLYQHLKESAVSKAEALQQAQLKLIQKGRYAHPYYWAPFVLVGEVK
jgi:CHAT domain-containing protein